ncbi:Protein kinase alk2 [Allomyces javanicus]|nr:Protein kinase alk2 [Allomyces javanicus]
MTGTAFDLQGAGALGALLSGNSTSRILNGVHAAIATTKTLTPLQAVGATFGTLVAALIAVLFYERKRKIRHDIPTIPTWGPLGNAPDMLAHRWDRLDWSLWKQRWHLDRGDGMTAYVWAPFQPTLIVTCDPRNVEHVLKTRFDNYIKGPVFDKIQRVMLGHGIFNADGEQWRVQRKTAANMFTINNFRDFMMHVFLDRSQILTSRLRDAARSGTIVDLHDLLYRFTLDSFMEIGYGARIDALKSDEPIPFAAAFDRAQTIINRRYSMGKIQWKVIEWFTGEGKEVVECMKVADKFAYDLIAKRRAEGGLESKNDLLSRLLVMKNPETGMPYPDVELRDMVLNFLIAGRDTTAQSLSWTFFELAKSPEAVAKFRAEISAACPDGEPDYQTVTKQLKYGAAILSEGLRLHPSVPAEIKFAVQDDVWPDGTRIRKGDGTAWMPWVMGRLPELWGDDALEFKPERWIDAKHPGPFKWPVFNGGPRTCLGQPMVYIQAVACLAEVTRQFDLELVAPEEVVYRPALTLQMKNGLRVRVHERGAADRTSEGIAFCA